MSREVLGFEDIPKVKKLRARIAELEAKNASCRAALGDARQERDWLLKNWNPKKEWRETFMVPAPLLDTPENEDSHE